MLERVSRHTATHDARATFLADRRHLVDDMFRLHLATGNFAAALQVADRARARVLRAMTVRARLENLSADRLAGWSERLSAYHAARETYEADQDRGRTLPPVEREKWKRDRARQRRELTALFDRATEVLDLEAPTAAQDAPPRLNANEVLLAFVKVGDETHGLRLAGGYVTHKLLVGDPLAPWLEGLRGRRHVYIIDGGVPEARALAQRTDGESVWGERIGISYLPYAGVLALDTTQTQRPPVVLADPTSDLPHARQEGALVAKALSVEALAGPAATRAALLGAEARWLHFAGHGVLRTGDPWAAHLRLAGGAQLTLTDILASRPKLGVVVLSGCETATTHALTGREPVGLPEAFLAAGARSVLASDAVLDDAAALRFVRAFYAASGGPSERLRATTAALRAKGDDAWKPWRVVGRR